MALARRVGLPSAVQFIETTEQNRGQLGITAFDAESNVGQIVSIDLKLPYQRYNAR